MRCKDMAVAVVQLMSNIPGYRLRFLASAHPIGFCSNVILDLELLDDETVAQINRVLIDCGPGQAVGLYLTGEIIIEHNPMPSWARLSYGYRLKVESVDRVVGRPVNRQKTDA